MNYENVLPRNHIKTRKKNENEIKLKSSFRKLFLFSKFQAVKLSERLAVGKKSGKKILKIKLNFYYCDKNIIQ